MFWTSLVFIVLALIAATISLGLRKYANKVGPEEYNYRDAVASARGTKIASFVLAGLALLFMLWGSITQVSTKNVGVVTSFGRPVGTLSNGIHLKAPWQKVTELDGAIQTDSHVGNADNDDTPCTSIRIGNNSTACVDNSIRWRIKSDQADSLFRDYRDFDKIRDSLVTRELNAALNTVFGDFNPLNQVISTTDKKGGGGTDLNELSNQVSQALRAKIGGDIEVINVIIPLVRFDTATQDKLNAYQAELANTRIAQQRQQTATAEALANKALSASVNNDPNVLVSKCFDVLTQMVKDKQSVPAGFTCWPGGSSAIVVPSGGNSK